ncbi:MAG: HPr family phosphocarrier protein, partial [Clostridia bacterium]|nr:HPr family phosphocarrier protein [Clostridia bacterium]
MQIFEYTVTAEEGLKAQDASRLVQIAAESGCTVTLEKNGKTVNA